MPDETTTSRPSAPLVAVTVVVTTLAAVGAGVIFDLTDPRLYLDVDGFEVFAPIFFAAQAVERFLEPLTSFWNPTTEKKEDVKGARENKLAAQEAAKATVAADPQAATAPPQPIVDALSATGAAETEALRALRKARAERRLLWFMVATVVSCLLAGFLGLGILEAMSTVRLEPGLGALDVALTGIVIGAGTQPLHDLVVRLQKSKENADPATKPTGQLPGTPGAPTTTPPVAPPTITT
jgi:hypothetical protein